MDVEKLHRGRDHGCSGIMELVNYIDVGQKEVKNVWR
jgi:hypothetical protein